MVIIATAVVAVVIAVVVVVVVAVVVVIIATAVVAVVIAAVVVVVVSVAVIFCEEICPLSYLFRTVLRHVQLSISLTCNSCFEQAFFFCRWR